MPEVIQRVLRRILGPAPEARFADVRVMTSQLPDARPVPSGRAIGDDSIITPDGRLILPDDARISIIRMDMPWQGDPALEELLARTAVDVEMSDD